MIKNFNAILLNSTGIGLSEVGARTCYNSFDKAKDDNICTFKEVVYTPNEDAFVQVVKGIKNIENSELLEKLVHTMHHESIIEHSVLTYYVVCSRGVLQELVRHRIASYSVQSTRYTMTNIINAFISTIYGLYSEEARLQWFTKKLKSFNMFTYIDEDLETLEIESIYKKLKHKYNKTEDGFLCAVLSKKGLKVLHKSTKVTTDAQAFSLSDILFDNLSKVTSKRNAGDFIKFIVSDMWKVELVMTINARSLKNFIKLRKSNAAWFPMKHLAECIYSATPQNIKNLIIKRGVLK